MIKLIFSFFITVNFFTSNTPFAVESISGIPCIVNGWTDNYQIEKKQYQEVGCGWIKQKDGYIPGKRVVINEETKPIASIYCKDEEGDCRTCKKWEKTKKEFKMYDAANHHYKQRNKLLEKSEQISCLRLLFPPTTPSASLSRPDKINGTLEDNIPNQLITLSESKDRGFFHSSCFFYTNKSENYDLCEIRIQCKNLADRTARCPRKFRCNNSQKNLQGIRLFS